MKEKVLVIGASENPERYAYKATKMLHEYGHTTVLFGKNPGEIDGEKIQTKFPEVTDIDTVTLYVGPQNQPSLYDNILALKPRRIIFNPGTENPALVELAKKQGIEPEIACTLVLLTTGQF